MFSFFNDDIFLSHMINLKFVEVSCIGLSSKIRAYLLAECSFIINITEINHNFGVPAAGQFHNFFPMGDSVRFILYIVFEKYRALI